MTEVQIWLLKKIKEVLDNLCIPFFLSCGTCLGAIRGGGFIKGDLDIDIGILGEYVNKVPEIVSRITPLFGGSPIIYHTIEDVIALIHWAKWVDGKEYMLDIALYYLDGDFRKKIIWRGFDSILYHIEGFSADLFMYPSPINLYGFIVCVPTPPEEYLAQKYGADWRTPNSKFAPWECKSIIKHVKREIEK